MSFRRGANPIRAGQPQFVGAFFCSFLLIMIAAGCGVPGEPVPPSPPIPVAVTDLSVVQRGDGVLLSFTPPNKSTRGERLNQTPTLEVLRGSLRADGLPDNKSFHVVDTLPGTLLSSYIRQGKVEFLEQFPAAETKANPGEIAVLRVRTRVSERKQSADSNMATVSLYPVPEHIEKIDTHETENSIQLTWPAPTRTSAGDPLSSPLSYHVYRGEIDPTSVAAAEKDLHAAVWQSPLLQIAATAAPEYQDSGFDYGKTYVYVVRSVTVVNGSPLESADSQPVFVTPKDIFPPAAPQDVVAALLPGAAPGTAIVDLSWAINVETDLAGYRVYRGEQENERGQLLNPALLPSPAYRDTGVVSGQRYSYTVTAVDRAGNESAPSNPVLVAVP